MIPRREGTDGEEAMMRLIREDEESAELANSPQLQAEGKGGRGEGNEVSLENSQTSEARGNC